MKSTILSIYPANNGRLNVDVTRDNRRITFVTKNKNIFLLLIQIYSKLFVHWCGEKFSRKVTLPHE
jgi:hypothetical protein